MEDERSLSIAERLPTDIIESILSCIDAWDDRQHANRAYISLSLVSRLWSDSAVAHMYRRPYLPMTQCDTKSGTGPSSLTTFPRLQRLHSILERRAELASKVQSLHLGHWTSRVKSEAAYDRRVVSELSISLIRLCPNVRALDLPAVVAKDRESLRHALASTRLLSSLTLGEGLLTQDDPWIVNFDPAIQTEWGTARWSVAEMGELMSGWPHLKDVRVAARMYQRSPTDRETDAQASKDLSVWPCKLRTFEFGLLRNAVVSFDYLNRMLGSSQRSLRRLKIIEHHLSRTDLIAVLENFGPSLRHLETVTGDLHDASRITGTIASHCQNLETLVLGSPVQPSPIITSLSHLPRLHTISLVAVRTIIEPQMIFNMRVSPGVALQRVDIKLQLLSESLLDHLDATARRAAIKTCDVKGVIRGGKFCEGRAKLRDGDVIFAIRRRERRAGPPPEEEPSPGHGAQERNGPVASGEPAAGPSGAAQE